MIQFFRKIRQEMLTENKLSKYLLYAIGEIFLVVVGILIALQINNANENAKKKDFEITILKNIQEDIVADKIDCELNQQLLEATLINEQKLLNFLLKDDNEQMLDSISFVNALGLDVLTAFHKASFNNLQNNDIGLISNNELYKKITRFYDFYVFSITKAENDHAFTNTYSDKLVYFKQHFKVIEKRTKVDISSDDAWIQDFNRYNFEVKDVQKLRADEEFKLVLAESLLVNSVMFDFYNQLFNKIDELDQDINQELGKLQ